MLTASIRHCGPKEVELYLKNEIRTVARVEVSSNVTLAANPTALVPLFLPIATEMEQDLFVEGDINPLHGEELPIAMLRLAQWDNKRPAKLVDVSYKRSFSCTQGVASTLSLGVDSFYTLRHHPPITHLITCRGFDISLKNHELWEQTVDICREVAKRDGKQLIEVVTNLREFSDQHIDWARRYHGAALVAMALLLEEYVSELAIPASYTNDRGIQWGSHSRLDPLWSSPSLTVSHHGIGVTRTEKMRAIANDEMARRHLRVCTKDDYNCTLCEKDIRTALNAIAAGVFDKMQSLYEVAASDILDMKLLAEMLPYHREILGELQSLPHAERRPDLEQALRARLV